MRVQVGLPAADVVVQLALSAEETAARGGYGQERYEKMDFQHKVRHQRTVLYGTVLQQGVDPLFASQCIR